MIIEHAVLDVKPGEQERFEQSFALARSFVTSSPGCRSLRLARCVEDRNRYLLLIEWDRIEDHTEGFRSSPAYGEWRKLLHHFYDPFPTVEHYKPLGG